MARKMNPSAFSGQIAAILRAQVAKFQLTQAEVADAVGISQSQLSKVLRGTRVLDVDQLDAICQVIDLDVGEVVSDAFSHSINFDDFESFTPLVEEGMRVDQSNVVPFPAKPAVPKNYAAKDAGKRSGPKDLMKNGLDST